MRTTSQFSFYCRKSKMDRNGEAPIELSICINGTRKFINLPFKCSPILFSHKNGHKNGKRWPQYLQDYIDSQRVRVATILTEMATNNIPVTAENLKEYFQTGGVKSYTIQDLFDEYYKLLQARVGKSLTATVFRKYEYVRDLFKEDIDFSRECTAITPAIIQGFYIKLQNRYQDSTSGGMMTKLKTVIKFGIDNGHIKINPFQTIKIVKGVKEIETITFSQLQAILNKSFVPRVQKVADMFIFACGSGLAYCDCVNLKPEDFVEKDGKLCIFKQRVKTGVKFYSVLLPWAVDVVKKYDYDFSDLQISNQKTNQYLKEIEGICNIPVRLHFHLARHFYAMYLLNQNVPITTVSKAIGHSTINQTQHYAKALETTIIDDIAKIM